MDHRHGANTLAHRASRSSWPVSTQLLPSPMPARRTSSRCSRYAFRTRFVTGAQAVSLRASPHIRYKSRLPGPGPGSAARPGRQGRHRDLARRSTFRRDFRNDFSRDCAGLGEARRAGLVRQASRSRANSRPNSSTSSRKGWATWSTPICQRPAPGASDQTAARRAGACHRQCQPAEHPRAVPGEPGS